MTGTEVESGRQDDPADRPMPHPHGVPAGTTTRFALLVAVVATSSVMFMFMQLLVLANSARRIVGSVS